LASQPLDIKGARYDAKDGYLLTSRGNPFGNVVKDGARVLLHSVSGQTIPVPILKSISQNKIWKSDFSRQAMFATKAHQEKMACLSCHGDLVQPCYGCHVAATTD
ncbi:cytochrome C, partial [bacterium]|nr:cytochrome C [bacterium]